VDLSGVCVFSLAGAMPHICTESTETYYTLTLMTFGVVVYDFLCVCVGAGNHGVGIRYVSPRVLCVNGRTWTRRPGNEHATEAERSAIGYAGSSGGDTPSDSWSSALSSNNGNGSGNGGSDSTTLVARHVGKTIGEFAGDYGVCLHLTVSTGLERDAVQQLKTLIAASPALSSLVKKVSAPRAGLVMLLAVPTVPGAGAGASANDVTVSDCAPPETSADLNNAAPIVADGSTDTSAGGVSKGETTSSTGVVRMCRVLANLLCSTNMVEKAYAVVAQQLHQVRSWFPKKRAICINIYLEYLKRSCDIPHERNV